MGKANGKECYAWRKPISSWLARGLPGSMRQSTWPSTTNVTITLIDRHSYFTYVTELHEIAADRVPEDAIQYDLQRLFNRRKNVKLVTDNVTGIDRDKKEVVTENGRFTYDYVI